MKIDRLLELASAMLNFIEEELYEDDIAKWFEDTFGMTEKEYLSIKDEDIDD